MTGDDEIPDDVVLPIEEALDLHAFAPRDVKDVVASYLEAALESGLGEVRIIHGRGIGFQREAVREILAHHPCVASFADAPPDRGGWGATVVRFKASSRPPG
jgi:dsDNA-specific endonuclease/ATPase MutS2